MASKRRRWPRVLLLACAASVLALLLIPALIEREVLAARRGGGTNRAQLSGTSLDWLDGTLTFRGLRVVRRETGTQVLAVPTLAVNWSWRHLLKGEVRLRVHVQSPTVHVPEEPGDEDGRGIRATFEELRDGPRTLIERMEVEDARISVARGGRIYPLEEVRVVGTDLSNRPNGEPTGKIELTGRVGENGRLETSLSGDLLAPSPNLELDVSGRRLPASMAGELEGLGVKPTDGQAWVRIRAAVEDERYRGTASARVADLEVKGTGKGNELVEGFVILGVELLGALPGEAGDFQRQVAFSGTLPQSDLTSSQVVTLLVATAAEKLGAPLPGITGERQPYGRRAAPGRNQGESGKGERRGDERAGENKSERKDE